MEIQQRLYIGGKFVPAEDGATLPSLNPHDNTPLADVSMAGKADIDKAVEAARTAFPRWSRLAAAERGHLLLEPLGVVGQVVPWNFPLMFTSWKMAPALAAGNCVVMKPAELTPLSSLRMAELMAEVGFPDGVVNIVPGLGSVAGQYLAEHPGVAKIAFTGSTATGRRIVQASAANLKKVQLELGGKGANIVFDDANLTAAVNGSAFAIFHNQGQACVAGSRLLLQEKIAEAFLARFLSYVQVAKDQGGEVLLGGKPPERPELSRGCYVEPTVVRARPADRVCQEEVFGPFVTVTTFRGDDEALAIANGTEYGLGGGLWTGTSSA